MKYNRVYTINLDEETAHLVEIIAQKYQRKPAELLRLILTPSLRAEWVKIQQAEHPQNAEPLTVARFNG